MDTLLAGVIQTHSPMIESLGLHKVTSAGDMVIRFEGAGWRLDFTADRYYSSGLIINLIEVGVKEYSLSILKQAVCEFECSSINEAKEQVAEYRIIGLNQMGHGENFEKIVVDLINFIVKKFKVIRDNKKEINKFYDLIAASKLREIGMKFVGE